MRSYLDESRVFVTPLFVRPLISLLRAEQVKIYRQPKSTQRVSTLNYLCLSTGIIRSMGGLQTYLRSCIYCYPEKHNYMWAYGCCCCFHGLWEECERRAVSGGAAASRPVWWERVRVTVLRTLLSWNSSKQVTKHNFNQKTSPVRDFTVLPFMALKLSDIK